MLFVAAVAVALVYLSWPVASGVPGGPSSSFTAGTAILIVGYIFYPVLALIVSGLLVIAPMLLIARVVERRRA
ncbi:MAG TPA: hypothetical protein VF001_07550 [Candidatus Limnocylindria bacterium]